MSRAFARVLAGVGVLTLVLGTAAPAPAVSGMPPVPSFLERVGDRLFFATYHEPSGGWQLRVSDGTATGTRLLASGLGLDIALQNVAGTLFFSTRGALWTSDGTIAGTVKIRDLDFFPTGLADAGAALYFTSGRGQLWRSDGTDAGTVLLADIAPGYEMYDLTPAGLTKVGDEIVFRALTPELGMELWQTDGTSAGTAVLADVNPHAGSIPSYFRASGDRLFFAADDGTHGNELFRTQNGVTELVKDINPFGHADPRHLREIGGILFFSADDGSGHELWRSDGTGAGTRRVRDINPDGASHPNALTEVAGTLYFRADDGEHGAELWRSDGSRDGTFMVADLHPSGSAFPRQLRDGGDVLVFAADDGEHGEELWRSDGTAAGTQRLTDLHPTGSAFPRNLTRVGSTIFFTADDGSRRHDLWLLRACGAGRPVPTCEVRRIALRSDGNDAARWQAFQVKDIVPGAAGSHPYYLTPLGDEIFFRATDDQSGTELWATDGTAAGTRRVADVNPGPASSMPYEPTVAGDLLYFSADDGRGPELWVTDGVTTRLVIDLNPGDWGSYPHELTAIGDVLYFVADDGQRGDAVWKTDGTAAGTVLLARGGCPDDPRELTVFGADLVFSANCGGRALWRSDGTPEGTRQVRFPGDHAPRFLAAAGSRLFMASSDWQRGNELWMWDGTSLGLVRDVVPNGHWDRPRGAQPEELRGLGDVVYYSADDQVHGRELWRSDGTVAGTTLVRDIAPGLAGSNPRRLTAVGDRLFFYANDGTSGWELWTSDGTEAGTRLVRDIDPTDTTAPSFFTPAGGLLFFSAQNPAFGRELWVSDGTEAGTALAADLNPVRSGYPESIVELDGTLFFYADDGGSGEELWAMAACGNGVTSPGEGCDDGNAASGDGCSAACRVEAPLPPPPGCTDARVCVAGSRLGVRGRETVALRLRLRDEAIVPPAPRHPLAPGLGGAVLAITNPTTGETMEIALPAEGWKPRVFRSGMGFRYEGNRASGCARVDLMPRGIRARCRRPAPELTLDEPAQGRLVATLRLGEARRFCAAFGGEIERDRGGQGARSGVFVARDAPAPELCE